MIYRYLLVLLTVSLTTRAAAQSPAPHTLWFHSLTAREGLNQSYNWYVYHDSEGFVWISSITGLSRFDGVHIRPYQSIRGDTTSLAGENIYSEFIEDARQNIWFSTPEAIHCYLRQRDRFRRFYLNGPGGKEISGEYKVHFLEKDSFLWVGTGEALYRFNIHASTGEAQKVLETQHFKCRMELDADGYVRRVFAFGIAPGMDVYDIRNGKMSGDPKHFFPREFIREVLPENDTRAWVLADESGLMDWDPAKGDNRFVWRQSAGHPGALVPWGRERLILVVKGMGVFVVDKQSRDIRSVDCKFIDGDGQAVQGFKNACLDRDENLWISDGNRGVHYANLNKTKFRSLPKHPSNGNTNYNFWSLVEDKAGNIWAGTSPEGIFLLDPSGRLIRHITHRPGDPYSLPSDWIRDILRDKDDNIWVATPNGLVWSAPGQYRFHQVPTADGKTDGHYIYLLQTEKGKMLVLSETEGVFEVRTVRGEKRLFPLHSALTGTFQTIFEDAAERLYGVRNSAAIYTFEIKKDSLICRDSIPEGGLVNGFYEEARSGMLYFATSNGLLKTDKKHLSAEPVVFTEPEGLPGKFVAAMLPDPAGRLWLGTGNGLALFQADSIRAFHRADGAQSQEFHLMAAMKQRNGDLWFGGSEGITIVPANVDAQASGRAPELLVTGIRINDEEPDSISCHLTGATNITRVRQIVLPYQENTISLEFVAIEYSDPSNNRLWYKLEGKDDKWVAVETGKPGFARYAKLPHGEYTFRLMAANSDGRRSAPAELLKIIIEPPWYLTWWFKLLSAATIVGLLYLFYRDRVARIRRKEEMLRKEAEFKQREAEFRQREAEAKQQMAETETAILRLQMNPHFIFNSMNSINAYILKQDINTASDYLGRFAHLMRMILNLAAKPFISIAEEVRLLEQYLRTEAMRFEKNFSYSFELDPAIDPDDTIVPTMILQPFVENAIWHGLLNKKGEGRIIIRFSLADGLLLCSVEDNGIGREAARQLRNGSEVHGSKALSITQRRLELLGEEAGARAGYKIVDLKDDTGVALGTRVDLHLPIL